jgi:hypothetical protein
MGTCIKPNLIFLAVSNPALFLRAASKMHRIFLLPEILIHIVTLLPPSELPTYASVSRHWRETLRLNLPPRLLPLHNASLPRPLPAVDSQSRDKLPQPVSTLARDILARTTQWLNPALLLDISDNYYFWHEGAYGKLLSELVPFLHPWLGKRVSEVIGGLEEMAKGEMGICFRMAMSVGEFDEQFAGDEDGVEKDKSSMSAYLTRPVTRSVEIYCVEGAVWDQEYKNVLHRQGRREWQQRCVRVERGRGVTMEDVVEELSGVLRTSRVGTETGGDMPGEVLLEWRFEESARRMLCCELFDSTG